MQRLQNEIVRQLTEEALGVDLLRRTLCACHWHFDDPLSAEPIVVYGCARQLFARPASRAGGITASLSTDSSVSCRPRVDATSNLPSVAIQRQHTCNGPLCGQRFSAAHSDVTADTRVSISRSSNVRLQPRAAARGLLQPAFCRGIAETRAPVHSRSRHVASLQPALCRGIAETWHVMRQLIAGRSPETVREMEEARGLR
jgi:hypothetical protein